MKKMIVASLVVGMFAASGAWAEAAQQSRMKTCNDDAGKQSLAGEARKAFMKSCLSGPAAAPAAAAPAAAATPAVAATPAAPGAAPQQNRMKTCNDDAGKQKLAGDARKTFMKSCLSGSAAAPAAAATPAVAATPAAPGAKPLTTQQQRMKDCNAEAKAKDMKGDPRKAFMKTCLSGK